MSYITTAEWCGLEKGRKEGRKEGRVEGRKEGSQGIFISLLEYKFKNVPDKYIALIHYADETKLKLWLQRVLDTSTIDDVFIDG